MFYCRTHLQYFLGKRDEISFKQFVKKLRKVQLISALCFARNKTNENLRTLADTIRRQQKINLRQGDLRLGSKLVRNCSTVAVTISA